jgi:hypothetical protein
MLEELFNLVKGSANDTVINNPGVPEEHNNEVIAEATNTVASGLRNMVAGGGLQNILTLFGNKEGANSKSLLSNPIVNMMIGHFASKLMSKFNLGGNQANNVASNLIPNVIGNLINNTNDPNNSTFSIDNLLHSITGGKSTEIARQQESAGNSGFNFENLVNQFTGGRQGNGTSAGGLMDIGSQLAGGAQGQQQQNGSGGLMDLMRGFMK